MSAALYRVGKPFACPAFDTSDGYYYCMVVAFCARQWKGRVTFMRPDVKRGPGHFVCFPKSFTTETVDFDGHANALVPLPYTIVRGRRMKTLVSASRHISVFLKYGGGGTRRDGVTDDVKADGSKNGHLLVLCTTAYALRMFK